MRIRSRQAAVRSLVWTLILAVTALFAAPPSGWASLAPADLQSGAAVPGAARAGKSSPYLRELPFRP